MFTGLLIISLYVILSECTFCSVDVHFDAGQCPADRTEFGSYCLILSLGK